MKTILKIEEISKKIKILQIFKDSKYLCFLKSL